MSKLIITGGKKLRGNVKVSGNKNSALKLMAAALLADSPSTLTNVPVIRDVQVMGELIKDLGANVTGLGSNTLTIDPSTLKTYELNPGLTERIRASVVLAAPLLSKFGRAVITPPGGDQIGERLLDTHFSMMREFGVKILKRNGKYQLVWKKRSNTDIFLEEASVTATEMGLILAASLSKNTRIEDAASEPHVSDLVEFLSSMGTDIKGVGTNSLLIKGKKKLKGTKHKVVPDHIEVGTFAILSAVTGGSILISDVIPEHCQKILHYLGNMGVKSHFVGQKKLKVLPSNLKARKRKFQTRPWPGFPTDLMSPFIILATQTEGTVLCHDWMYEWRMFFVDDLIQMGANIFIADPHRVIVSGPTKLNAETLYCKDIRAGMSVILAALVARGKSEIRNIEMVERGYEDIVKRLSALGADITEIKG
ncbi:UDP-N-acetylglucosamine 1-carboxyvinyltransferase [Patescibacteria group bacterium]|nr:UDP-N-acetylglucosamine 1-carboxyvinyltransferase [Patescibacteria group bacterium]